MPTVTSATGQTVTVRVRPVGQAFGVVGEVVARNGRVVATTPDTYPLTCGHRAVAAGVRLALDYLGKEAR